VELSSNPGLASEGADDRTAGRGARSRMWRSSSNTVPQQSATRWAGREASSSKIALWRVGMPVRRVYIGGVGIRYGSTLGWSGPGDSTRAFHRAGRRDDAAVTGWGLYEGGKDAACFVAVTFCVDLSVGRGGALVDG